MWGTEYLQSVPSSSMALQPIFRSGTPHCWGFQIIEFLYDKDVSLMSWKASESLFVWHLAQNLSSMGGPTSSYGGHTSSYGGPTCSYVAAGIAFEPRV
jgi:hypothetical protein